MSKTLVSKTLVSKTLIESLQDNKAAVKWWTGAAELGDTRTAFLLGCMYARGARVPQDYVLAHMWFDIAAGDAAGDTVRQNRSMDKRDSIAKKMTPAEIKEAKKLARDWMKKYRNVK